MKIIKRALIAVIILVIIFVIIFGSKIFGTGYTPAIIDEDGNVFPGSIASLEKINLGGMEQSILIRGNDENNPILLWL